MPAQPSPGQLPYQEGTLQTTAAMRSLSCRPQSPRLHLHSMHAGMCLYALKLQVLMTLF